MMGDVTPRPEYEWSEDEGPVIWWLWPIEEAPYIGTPLDLGYTVEGEMELTSSCRSTGSAKVRMQVGGWPYGDEQDDRRHRLWWTPLPDSHAIDTFIRDQIRGYPEPTP